MLYSENHYSKPLSAYNNNALPLLNVSIPISCHQLFLKSKNKICCNVSKIWMIQVVHAFSATHCIPYVTNWKMKPPDWPPQNPKEYTSCELAGQIPSLFNFHLIKDKSWKHHWYDCISQWYWMEQLVFHVHISNPPKNSIMIRACQLQFGTYFDNMFCLLVLVLSNQTNYNWWKRECAAW